VVLVTEAGDIEIELDLGRAPVTAGNFLKYLDAGMYKNGVFFRTVRLDNQPDSLVKIEVVQATSDPARDAEAFAAIPLERTTVTGLRHTDGAISMGRAAPDTAQSSFFICINDQPELDVGGRRNPDGQGFAAFGHVTRGMDVVRKIQSAPHDQQTLTPFIRILDARRVKPAQ
jgi:peptidyl-prolyl cis-trans isomerase A (cyclophilin A)